MKRSTMRWGVVALVAAALAGCGGNGGDGGGIAPPPATSVGVAISNAARNPANDTSTNSSSAFKVVQDAGVPAVTVKSLAKVNMTYVPFPGGAPAVTALIGGHVDMVFQNLSESIE